MDEYEQGSMDAANAIIAFMRRKGHGAAANDVLMAWENDTIYEPITLEQVERKADKMMAAKASGYTGDECPKCQSMKMIHTGHCNTCQDCGETTGCS